MASQISHIVYAKKFFNSLETGEIYSRLSKKEKETYPLSKIDKDEFLLGSVFPDIRRIDGIIKRKDTHLRFSQIDLDFSNLTSFEAGWKFHLYCDMKREDILNKHDFYSIDCTNCFAGYSAKILEDELVYENYNNWEKLKHFFNKPIFVETGLATEETFNLWYAILAKYIEKKPDDQSIRSFLVKQPSVASDVLEIMKCISTLRENKKAIEMLKKVNEEII